MPYLGEMSLNPLTGEVAVCRGGRNDFPHADDAGLFRQLAQQSHWHVGFDIVLADIARVAVVILEEVRHIVHVS